MGKYIYQSHMGGLYACDEQQDYEFLYCEQCGDSDTLIGYAKSVYDAWELLKSETDTFDDSVCEECEYKDDYDYCDEKCQEYANSGGYSLAYIMEFLHSEFSEDTNWDKIYLLLQPKKHPEYYMANCSVHGYKFGEKHSLLSQYCLPNENHSLIAKSLTGVTYDECGKIEFVKTLENNGIKYHIYKCEADVENNDNWSESASHCDGNWYGYFTKDTLNLVNEDKFILT